MTTVTIEKRQGGYVAINLVGHANYNPGNDIVCSSISTIVGFLAKNCDKIAGSRATINPGDCSFYFPEDRIVDIVAELFEELAEDYPDNVKVIKKNFVHG